MISQNIYLWHIHILVSVCRRRSQFLIQIVAPKTSEDIIISYCHFIFPMQK